MDTRFLSDEELDDLHRRIWEAASGENERGWRRHSAGVKQMLRDYGIPVKPKMGGALSPRRDVLVRLEARGVIERIGGGDSQRTRSLWVAPPN